MARKKREEIKLALAEEIVISVGRRKFILRGIGGKGGVKSGIQIFGIDYLKENARKIYGGSTHGIVRAITFGVGYEDDIDDSILEKIEILDI